jgi:hypothetical protein
VDHLAVARRRFPAEPVVLFEQEYVFVVRAQAAGNGKADNTGADNAYVKMFQEKPLRV